MAKDSIRDYSAVNSENTDIQSIDISEGCSPAGINNAIREVMADIKDVSTGTVSLETPSADQLNVDNLRLDGNTISSTDTNGNITIDPNGTGNVTVVGTLSATALTGDGSALTGVASDVVDDTTPQLGGDLDLNSNGITGTGDIDITGKVIASTNVGVGTSSPAVAIHATKTTGTSQRVRMENSEGSADFGTDSNRALIYVAGNQRLRLDSDGKLLLNAEGGSVATVDVRQGSAKHWVHFTGTGTPSVQDSHNHTSITDRGTGDYSVNINNNMNNSNYISSGQCGWDGTGWAGNLFHYEGGMSTGAYRIITARPDSLSKRDMLSVMPMAHGDLA